MSKTIQIKGGINMFDKKTKTIQIKGGINMFDMKTIQSEGNKYVWYQNYSKWGINSCELWYWISHIKKLYVVTISKIIHAHLRRIFFFHYLPTLSTNVE